MTFQNLFWRVSRSPHAKQRELRCDASSRLFKARNGTKYSLAAQIEYLLNSISPFFTNMDNIGSIGFWITCLQRLDPNRQLTLSGSVISHDNQNFQCYLHCQDSWCTTFRMEHIALSSGQALGTHGYVHCWRRVYSHLCEAPHCGHWQLQSTGHQLHDIDWSCNLISTMAVWCRTPRCAHDKSVKLVTSLQYQYCTASEMLF